MEYLPTTLSKIITNLSLNGRFIANEQATGFAYCLLRGLRDIHVTKL